MNRVAHVMAGAVHGGAELFFERLCVGLHRAGTAVLPVIRTNPARAALLREAGMAPVELRFGTSIDILTRPRLRAALRDFAPDAVVYWMNRANQHAVRGPWVNVGRLGGYYDLRYYRRCDHLVGNTRGIVTWLRGQGWAPDRTHYVPNFVDDFAATPPATDIHPGRPLLLALGRLHTDKGFDTLLAALPRIPHATLAIAGVGPEEAALRERARREGVAGRVHFLGWRRDAGALLKAADVFVCSSRIEPLGNMVIEAWSAGCPVAAIAAAGPAELIRDGQDGLVSPLEDSAALAASVVALLENPAQAHALAAAGRARFDAEFAQASVVRNWQDFLAKISQDRR
jgi:glycosyltransferase involved in cell wall biosynthesis